MGARGPKANTEHLYKRGNIWWCWFYDHAGVLQRRSTGTTDKKAARARLAEWEQASADPDAREHQTLNDCLQALLEDRGTRTGERNVSFLGCKVKPLVTILGHDLSIDTIRDSSLSWRYIDQRRRMEARGKPISDRTIKRELGVLRMALEMAKSRGLWSGDLDVIVPPDFTPAAAPKGDSITRSEALRIFPHLSPDSAAGTAFVLATGAELSGIGNAMRADLPEDLSTCSKVLVRGTKNAGRCAVVPIVTDEQRLLLEYARKYAKGVDGKLFGNLHRLLKELRDACIAEGITVVSPHDLRRSAGQWMVDLSVPIELVSKFLRHADSRITETIYASVRREDVGDRILDAIDPRYARTAHRDRTKPVVETLKRIPEPRRTETLYQVGEVAKSLTEWSRASGIAKPTLHGRVVTRGMSMADALALGRPNYRDRTQSRPPADCERGVRVSVDPVPSNGPKAPPSPSGTPSFPGEFADLLARHSGFEPLAFGFGGWLASPFSVSLRDVASLSPSPLALAIAA
jgi:integrase